MASLSEVKDGKKAARGTMIVDADDEDDGKHKERGRPQTKLGSASRSSPRFTRTRMKADPMRSRWWRVKV